jgi:hypothetical protein
MQASACTTPGVEWTLPGVGPRIFRRPTPGVLDRRITNTYNVACKKMKTVLTVSDIPKRAFFISIFFYYDDQKGGSGAIDHDCVGNEGRK